MEVPPVALEDSKVEEHRGKLVSLDKVIWDRRTGDSTWRIWGNHIRICLPCKFSFSRSKIFLLGRM